MLPARFCEIRTRILAIALVPSLVLLVIGVVLAAYLTAQGRHAKQFSDTFSAYRESAHDLILAVEQERFQSLWQLAGNEPNPRELAAARAAFDESLRKQVATQGLLAAAGGSMNDSISAFNQLQAKLPQLRGGVDHGTLPPADAYHFFSALLDYGDESVAALGQSENVPDPTSTLRLMQTVSLLHVVEANARAAALTVTAAGPAGLPADLVEEYRDQVGAYRVALTQVAVALPPELSKRATDIVASSAWQQLGAMETALLTPAKPGAAQLPMSVTDWRGVATHVNEQLLTLWSDLYQAAQDHARAAATDKANNSLLAGALTAAVAIAAFVLSLLLANRLIGRLKRLRTETLALAEEQLPETMRKLGAGEQVDPETDSARLDFGSDEIGSVASAFNRAHTAAVTAAVTEARTREGVRAVFLNIAQRSQLVVHRLLEILDDAERRQEDPEVLEILFRLDHLATRERRNAENLIILGGGRPGRKWRRPVDLLELVRSAVAETLDYARVRTGRLPRVFVAGDVVADLIHLLAELVDNATAFSPPGSRVEVSGGIAGKGVIVEIGDQGTGMTPEDLARANAMLSRPPDFAVATLSSDSRLGLFVVARLAVRHGISVKLSDSVYGGVRAIVLIPNSLITTGPAGDGSEQPALAEHSPGALISAMRAGEVAETPVG
ncbi:sensor histidine kinase [Nocardia sp. NPDC003482]